MSFSCSSRAATVRPGKTLKDIKESDFARVQGRGVYLRNLIRGGQEKGVAVVRATRTGSGLVVRNVEVDDDELGFIAAMELSPQKARILLMLGLMRTTDPKALQKLCMEY